MEPLAPWALANTVTAYATTLSGVLALLLTALVAPQPRRWIGVYACIVITGIATVWYHGFGETPVPRLADIGSNYLVTWALQVAVLGDYYSRRTRLVIAGASAAVNLATLGWMASVDYAASRVHVIPLGEFGGFTPGEVVLIANALLVTGLFYARRRCIPLPARPVLNLVVVTFVLGMLLATASNRQVDLQILAWHATWHVVGAFGFIALWAFNHVRFAAPAPRTG